MAGRPLPPTFWRKKPPPQPPKRLQLQMSRGLSLSRPQRSAFRGSGNNGTTRISVRRSVNRD